MAGAGVVQSNLQGQDIVMIAGVINTLTFQFIVDRNISHPERLNGKAVGVTRKGSSTDFAMRYALDKYGLLPGRDVAIVELETMPALLAALEAGTIQGAMLSAPTTLKAKKAGFPVLADLQMLGLEYQHTGMATSRALIRNRSDLVRNVMKAYVEAIHYYKTHRRESLGILAKYLKTNDTDALTEIYEDIGLTLVPEKPYPTLRGIEIMLRELADKEPRAKVARPEQFVDVTFVKELDTSGFVDRLYKASPVLASRGESRPGAVPASVGGSTSTKPAPAVQKKVKSAAGQGSRDYQEYTVKKGDTLSHIAERFYGGQWKWGKIYEANKQTIKNPHFIYIGQKIVIPPQEAVGT